MTQEGTGGHMHDTWSSPVWPSYRVGARGKRMCKTVKWTGA